MELSNRTVLVTGGTSGIGLGIAESFLRSKSKVIVCGRNKEKLSTIKDRFPDIMVLPVMSATLRKGRNSQRKYFAVFPTSTFWLTTRVYRDTLI